MDFSMMHTAGLSPRRQLLVSGALGSCKLPYLLGFPAPLVHLGFATQVVILGAGSIIGDMSLQAGAKRSATVVALTELVTFKVAQVACLWAEATALDPLLAIWPKAAILNGRMERCIVRRGAVPPIVRAFGPGHCR